MVEEKINIEGLKLFSPKVFEDERGYFTEFYNKEDFDAVIGEESKFVQDNISCSHKNVIRGLHFQKPPFSQGKLIQVLRGKVMDVIVDIRRDSKTYGEHCKIELSDKNHKKLWIPSGFAHGFQTLEDNTEVIYQMSEFYYPGHSSGFRWNDPSFNIKWPTDPRVISSKDQSFPDFNS